MKKSKKVMSWLCPFCNAYLDTEKEAKDHCLCIGCAEFKAENSGYCKFCFRSTDFVLEVAENEVRSAAYHLQEARKNLNEVKKEIARYNAIPDQRKGMDDC